MPTKPATTLKPCHACGRPRRHNLYRPRLGVKRPLCFDCASNPRAGTEGRSMQEVSRATRSALTRLRDPEQAAVGPIIQR